VPVPIVTDNDLRRLLKACEGTDFESRRDMAILRLFIDTGCRLAEITDSRWRMSSWRPKSSTWSAREASAVAPYGPKTSSALDDISVLRKRHPQSHCPALCSVERWPKPPSARRADTQAALRDGGYRSAASSSVRHTAAQRGSPLAEARPTQ